MKIRLAFDMNSGSCLILAMVYFLMVLPGGVSVAVPTIQRVSPQDFQKGGEAC